MMRAPRGRRVAILLATLMVSALMMALWAPTALATFGDTGTTADDFTWVEATGSKITITGYVGSAKALTIPSTVNGLPVTAIANGATFSGQPITSVDIPGSVTYIGLVAFRNCMNLSSVTLRNGLLTIQPSAFENTAITIIEIPSTVNVVAGNAFRYCGNLTKAVIWTKTATFGAGAFGATAIDSDGSIYGFAGSTAQTYASANDHPFHYIYTVVFEGTSLSDEYVLEGEDLSTPPTPTKAGYVFDGWFTDPGLTTGAVFPMAVAGDMTLYAKWTELKLTLSPADGHIYTGGRITITPNVEGGTWGFDSKLLSRDGYAFTGLKAGTAHVTYTVGSESVSADVVITASTLPDTGQDFTTTWALLGAGLLVALMALMLVAIERPRRRAR